MNLQWAAGLQALTQPGKLTADDVYRDNVHPNATGRVGLGALVIGFLQWASIKQRMGMLRLQMALRSHSRAAMSAHLSPTHAQPPLDATAAFQAAPAASHAGYSARAPWPTEQPQQPQQMQPAGAANSQHSMRTTAAHTAHAFAPAGVPARGAGGYVPGQVLASRPF